MPPFLTAFLAFKKTFLNVALHTFHDKLVLNGLVYHVGQKDKCKNVNKGPVQVRYKFCP